MTMPALGKWSDLEGPEHLNQAQDTLEVSRRFLDNGQVERAAVLAQAGLGQVLAAIAVELHDLNHRIKDLEELIPFKGRR